VFKNRFEAGRLLAKKILSSLSSIDFKNAVVLGIPRGGVVTAAAVSQKLQIPLSIVVTKKIGAPGQEELAVGAMAEDGSIVLDHDLIRRLAVDKKSLGVQIESSRLKVKSYRSKFKVKRPKLKGKIVILVDDGVATGATAEAAILCLKRKKPQELIVATPVSSRDSYESIQNLVDEIVVLETPEDFYAVGQFYRDFPQVTDEEVKSLLHK